MKIKLSLDVKPKQLLEIAERIEALSGCRPTCGGNNNNNNKNSTNTAAIPAVEIKPLQPSISDMSNEDIAAEDQEINVCSDDDNLSPPPRFTANSLLSLTGGNTNAAVKLSHAFSIAALMKK